MPQKNNNVNSNIIAKIPSFYGFRECHGFIGLEIHDQIERETEYLAEEYGLDFSVFDGCYNIHNGIDYEKIAEAFALYIPDWIKEKTGFLPESITFHSYQYGKIEIEIDEADFNHLCHIVTNEPGFKDYLEKNPYYDARWLGCDEQSNQEIMEKILAYLASYDRESCEYDDPEYYFIDYGCGYDDIANAIAWKDIDQIKKDIEERKSFDPWQYFFGNQIAAEEKQQESAA